MNWFNDIKNKSFDKVLDNKITEMYLKFLARNMVS